MPPTTLTARQREVLEIIEQHMRERGYPPSVREIGEAVGLTSPSTVHAHLAALQRRGYLRRDPTKPRAIEVRWDPNSDAAIERRPVRHVPLRRRRRRRHRRAGPGERRGGAAAAGRLHRRGRPVHAAGPGRLDDRGRHPRRRLRRVPVAGDGRERRRRRGRHPRRRGDGEDLHHAGQVGRAAAGQSPARADGVRARARSRSSVGSSPCCGGSDHGARSGKQVARGAPKHGVEGPARSTRSSRVWASVGVAGPEVGGGDAGGGEAADVGPAELGPHVEAVAVAQRRQQRMVRLGGAAPATSTTSTVSPSSRSGASTSSTWASRLVGGAVGREAVVERHHRPVGHDVAGHAALDEHGLQRLAELAAVDHRPACRRSRPSAASSRPARWRALRPIHGRAVWARAPCIVHLEAHRALASGLERGAGRLAEQRRVAGHEVGPLGEQVPEPVVLGRHLLAPRRTPRSRRSPGRGPLRPARA